MEVSSDRVAAMGTEGEARANPRCFSSGARLPPTEWKRHFHPCYDYTESGRQWNNRLWNGCWYYGYSRNALCLRRSEDIWPLASHHQMNWEAEWGVGREKERTVTCAAPLRAGSNHVLGDLGAYSGHRP